MLLRTAKYYSSTTSYYKVLVQYYFVLQSTSPVLQSTIPVLLRTTKYYSSTTLYYKVLLQYYSVLKVLLRTTKYYSSTTKWLTCLIIITYETSFTMRGATNVTLQTHSRNLRKTAETSFPMRGRSDLFYCKIQHFAPNLTFKPSPNTAPATKSDTSTSPNTAPATKSDTSTSRSTAPATKSDTWPSPSTAPATKSDTWTSPSTAPATKSDTHDSSSSHMKPHLQCAEQQMSPSKLTKYCACHAKWPPNIWQKFAENSWNVISNAGPIRPWSEHDPTTKTQTATRLASEVTFRAHHEHFLL